MKKIIIKYINILTVWGLLLSSAQAQTVSKDDNILSDSLKTPANRWSHTTVSADELQKSNWMLNSTNVYYQQLLGITASQLARPNAPGSKLMARNISYPLVIIDGVERDIENFAISEIENIEFVSDATALAIYGFKAKAGALLITTKQGKGGKLNIEANYSHGVKFAEKPQPMVDAKTYALGYNEARINDGRDIVYDQNAIDYYQSGQRPMVFADVDWYDEVMKDAAYYNQYNVSVSGGSKNIKTFTSINYQTDQGFIKLSKPDKDIPNQFQYSSLKLRSNLSARLTNSTVFKVKLAGRITESSRGNDTGYNLIKILYNTPANAFPVKTENGKYGIGKKFKVNPVAKLMETGFYKDHIRALTTNFIIEQDLKGIVPGLRLTASLSHDNFSRLYEIKTKEHESEIVTPVFKNGELELTYQTVGKNQGSYNFNSGLGWEKHRTNGQVHVSYAKAFSNSSLNLDYIGFIENYRLKDLRNTYNRVSNNLIAKYSFADKYELEGVINLSGSNILDPKDNWGYMPAVKVGWIASNEKFFQNLDMLNYLKLDMSYGIIGNDHFKPDQYISGYGGGGRILLGDNATINTIKRYNLPVDNLAYQKQKIFNLRVQTQLFDHWFATANIFKNSSYDLFITQQHLVSEVLGVQPGLANVGKNDYKGYELALTYQGLSGDWKYSVTGRFSAYDNEIINVDEKPWPYEYGKRTGKRLGQLFGYKAIGFFKDQNDIENSPKQLFGTVNPGSVKYADIDNNGTVDEYDRIALGEGNKPRCNFGLNLSVAYKNFSVDMVVDGIAKYETLMNRSLYSINYDNNFSQEYYDNRWSENNQNAKYPALTLENNENNLQESTLWLEDCSFVKLRTLRIAYQFPKTLIGRIKATNAEVFLAGYNLFSIDNVEGDPEARGFHYPMHRVLSAGINVNF
ncbi:MAG: SusC/RagA family TonB-linked outer membrane protein [Cytophagales bacterium]|nr:SusC/RagA family TonB-linked outer membrane protein [Cytophagales bacterium]